MQRGCAQHAVTPFSLRALSCYLLLSGLLPPSGGEMLLCGESILTEGGLDRATGLIGVCPQFDVLWGELTGLEHLLVAAHVKGLPGAEVGAPCVCIIVVVAQLLLLLSQYIHCWRVWASPLLIKRECLCLPDAVVVRGPLGWQEGTPLLRSAQQRTVTFYAHGRTLASWHACFSQSSMRPQHQQVSSRGLLCGRRGAAPLVFLS